MQKKQFQIIDFITLMMKGKTVVLFQSNDNDNMNDNSSNDDNDTSNNKDNDDIDNGNNNER